MSEINGEVDRLLAEHRPDRYVKDGGDGWLDDVADLVAGLIPEAEARVIHARSLVRNREGQKLQSANRVLRDVFDSRQPPLDWLDLLPLPIAVGKERVALRACTPEDFRQFAVEERRRSAGDFTVRNHTCDAAEWMAEEMRAQGAATGAEIRLDVES